MTDEDDAPGDQSTKSKSFAKEQAMIAKLVQSLDNDDLAVLFKMHHLKEKAFGKGGKTIIKYTLVRDVSRVRISLFSFSLTLVSPLTQ